MDILNVAKELIDNSKELLQFETDITNCNVCIAEAVIANGRRDAMKYRFVTRCFNV